MEGMGTTDDAGQWQVNTVLESEAFLMGKEYQKWSAIKLRKLQVTYNGPNEALPLEAAVDMTI